MRAVVERAWGERGGMQAGYLAGLGFALRQNKGTNWADERWSGSGPEYIVPNTVPRAPQYTIAQPIRGRITVSVSTLTTNNSSKTVAVEPKLSELIP